MRPYVRPKAARRGEENVIFSWREIAGVLLGNQRSEAIVRQCGNFKLEEKYLISISRKKKFKRILSFFGGERQIVHVTKFAFKESSLLCSVLRTRSAHCLSPDAAVPTVPNIAQLLHSVFFFSPQP